MTKSRLTNTITTKFIKNQTCDICDVSMNARIWKGYRIAYSSDNNKIRGFVCINCALRPTRKRSALITEQQVDQYIRALQ